MKYTRYRLAVLMFALLAALSGPPVLAQAMHYGAGDVVDQAVTVSDAAMSRVSLRELLAARPSRVNVVFIFGGGDLGAGMPGHLWCQDSFEDTHILRSLYASYADADVDFIPIAAVPAYHSQVLGAPAGVFLNAGDDSEAFQSAAQDFIASTLRARELGILPVDPWFDLRYALKLNRDERWLPPASYGALQAHHGAFRAADETQFYGVPSFWLLSDEGEILAPPLRGNIYHPHGTEVRIRYTLADVDAAIAALLGQ